MKPSEFWAASDSDKIYMTAYMLSTYEMKAVEDYEKEQEMERLKRKSHGKH